MNKKIYLRTNTVNYYYVVLFSAQTLRINYGKDAVSDEPLNTAIMVDKMIVYPYFRIEGAHHDIALLKLSIPVEQTSIAYVELPKTTAQDYVGQTATVSGWGAQGK